MGLLLYLFLFWGHNEHHCPAIQPEKVPIFKPILEVSFFDLEGNPVTVLKTDKGYVNYTMATITLDSFGISNVQIGEKTDPEAVAHNKRVKECKTMNGEF